MLCNILHFTYYLHQFIPFSFVALKQIVSCLYHIHYYVAYCSLDRHLFIINTLKYILTALFLHDNIHYVFVYVLRYFQL